MFGGRTGVASPGDGSAPQRGVGVEQSGDWLRWIRMVVVFVLAVRDDLILVAKF